MRTCNSETAFSIDSIGSQAPASCLRHSFSVRDPATTLIVDGVFDVYNFTGLVRFIPRSGGQRILIGQPVKDDIDVGLALFRGQSVDVEVFSGSSVLSPGKYTGKTETVERILSPLAQNEVGTIRCIGLNVGTVCQPRSVSKSNSNPLTVSTACSRSGNVFAYDSNSLHVSGKISISSCRQRFPSADESVQETKYCNRGPMADADASSQAHAVR